MQERPQSIGRVIHVIFTSPRMTTGIVGNKMVNFV